MVDQQAVARSPIAQRPPVGIVAGWEVSRRVSSAGLRLSDQTAVSKVLVRSENQSTKGVFGCGFGRALRDAKGNLVAGTAPGEWLVLGPPATATEISTALVSQHGLEPASIVDVTHGGCLLRLMGADAHRLLEKLCAIDLSDAVVGNGVCFRSSVARVVCDVVRDDFGGDRSYLIHGERSTGQYLFDSLLDAGAEFDLDVDGYQHAGSTNEEVSK